MTLFLTHRLRRIEYQEVLQVTHTVWLAFKTFFTVPRCNPLSCIVCHSAYGSYDRLSQWALIDGFTMGTLLQYSTQPFLEYLRSHSVPTFMGVVSFRVCFLHLCGNSVLSVEGGVTWRVTAQISVYSPSAFFWQLTSQSEHDRVLVEKKVIVIVALTNAKVIRT